MLTWETIKVILIVLGVIALIALMSFFAVRNHIDRKAEQLSRGSEEDRQLASEMREISRQINRGNMYR